MISSSLEELQRLAVDDWSLDQMKNIAIGLTALTDMVIDIKKILPTDKNWKQDIE